MGLQQLIRLGEETGCGERVVGEARGVVGIAGIDDIYFLASVSCELISRLLLSVCVVAGGGGHDAGPPLMPFKRTKMPESTVRRHLCVVLR